MPEDKAQETPEQGVEAPPEAAPPRKRGVSGGAIAALVIGVVVVVAVTFYAAEIKHFFVLQPWSKAAPLAVVESASQALKNRDKAALLAVGPSLPVVGEETLEGVKPGPQAQRTVSVEELTPVGGAADAVLQYDYRPMKGFVAAYLPTASGEWVSMTLKREKGEWQVTSISLGSAPEE